MKKTLFAALALAFVASCSNEEVVEMAQKEAIGFDNAFVNNSTRSVNDPSYSSTTDEGKGMFEKFQVYGFVEGAALWTDGETVTGPSTWTYTNTQYWINGADYTFHAVAPETGWTKTDATAEGGVSLSFTNNGESDVLYAYATAEGKPNGQNAPVELTFRHILSKVKFSFKNEYDVENATIKVSDIHITNAYATGDATLNNSTTSWDNQEGTLNLDFGDVTQATATQDVADAYGVGTLDSYNECLLIPSEAREYEVTFTVQLLISNTPIATYNHKANVSLALVAANSYNITAKINTSNIDPNNEQDPIEFTVTEITGWTPGTNPDEITTTEPNTTTQP